MTEATHACRGCKVEFPVSTFRSNNSKWKNWQCLPCFNAYRRHLRKDVPGVRERANRTHLEYRKRNLDRIRKRRRERLLEIPKEERTKMWLARTLKYLYGITVSRYNEILEMQNGVCAICGQTQSMRLFVDHDHRSGVIRGLLCSVCNLAIARFDEDPKWINKAHEYLNKRRR